MPTAEFFNQLGILTVRNFLDSQVCDLIAAEVCESRLIKGRRRGVETHTDMPEEEYKGVRLVAEPSATSLTLIESALLAQMPVLERHFAVNLREIEKPGFSVYRKGCGFIPHFDLAPSKKNQPGERKISAVIYLNQETEISPSNDSYSGGKLTFYGLMENPLFAEIGLPLVGEKGMLVAFLPTIMHSVTPVTDGERYVAVSWYS